MRGLSNRERTERFAEVCREHGLPVTIQRRTVFEIILDREDHPTADQIYDEVRTRIPGVSRTTVYRILEAFVRLGLITKICHPGSSARFDPKVRQHHHLVCVQCERIFDIESERLNAVEWPDVRSHGFEIEDYHIHFRGTCADCRRSPQKGGRTVTTRSKRKTQSTVSHKNKQANRKRRTQS